MDRPTRILTALILAFTVGLASARAQEIGFTANVDRTSIATGEPVKLTISLTNSQERFNPPDLGGMVIMQGPFENSSFQYVNGRMSSSLSRTWTLTAGAPGRYTIGPARIKVGGGIIQTEPITIEVTQGATRQRDEGVAEAQKGDPNLFATISVSKNKGYVGDQIVVSYMIYTRYSSIELAKFDLPKLNGFWSEEIDIGNAGWENDLRTVNGIQYKVAVLKKQLLFPQRSGKLRIEPMALTCLVNRSFFNRGTSIDVRSNAAEFNALDLPAGAPSDFNGAVGELQMTVQADRTSIKADEAIEIGIRFSGRSNLKLLQAPKLDLPGDFEAYDPKVVDKITVNGSGMNGSREFQYTVIPRHDGHFELAPITFSYFDTGKGAYRTLSGAPLEIEVAAGEGGSSASVQRPMRSDVVALENDIRYIRTGDLDMGAKGRFLFGSVPWIAGMTAPALAFVLFVGLHRRRERARGDIHGTRRKKAQRVAKQRLREAEHALAKDDRGPFYTALSKALHGYLSDKFALGVAEVNTFDLREKFTPFEGGEKVADECIAILNACDMARFAPVEDRPRKALYTDAADLIQRIEQLVRT